MYDDITEGAFLSIARFWESVRAGKIDLRKNLLNPRSSLDDLSRSMAAFELSRIATRQSRVGSTHYTIEVKDRSPPGGGWEIYLDLVEGAVRIFDLAKSVD